jgi:nucleoside-diphosphate-sugar epimerase
MAIEEKRVLLTGASGYVGGRLIPLLEKQPVKLRCDLDILTIELAKSSEQFR